MGKDHVLSVKKSCKYHKNSELFSELFNVGLDQGMVGGSQEILWTTTSEWDKASSNGGNLWKAKQANGTKLLR